MSDQPLPSAITRFFDALPTRDADTIGDCFTEDASYYFLIPGPAVTGRENLKTMFKGLGTMFSRVEWEIVKHGGTGDLIYVERIDKFWLPDGNMFGIECIGVFELQDGLIAEVRDYADMVTWRKRITALVGPKEALKFLPEGNGLE